MYNISNTIDSNSYYIVRLRHTFTHFFNTDIDVGNQNFASFSKVDVSYWGTFFSIIALVTRVIFSETPGT